jgi:DNA-binding LacI/PurR family transcriptional regulator
VVRRQEPGPRRPTIADIARRAGVSKGSVSYALNGRPGVSEPTRRRILEIAEEVGWHPNRAARALSAARSGACGLALARPARALEYEPFFSELFSGIEAELSARQVALMLQIVEDVEAETVALRRWWAETRVDGVLLVDLRVDDPRVPLVEELGLPAVIVGGPGPTGSLSFFPGGDANGVFQIVQHLLMLGHRRIDRVAGSPEFAHTQLRTDVFAEALAGGGATGSVMATDYSHPAAAEATRQLLAGSPPPTAIVYDSDLMAVAGLSTAQEMGVDVPGELSIASFDDSLICRVVRPALTACARDVVGYGAQAARALLSLVEDDPLPPYVVEPPKLVPRASTAPPPVAAASRGRRREPRLAVPAAHQSV